jgi:hypothetical protein
MCQYIPPAQLLDNLLKHASYSQRIALLLRAKEANEKQLQQLTAFRLACIEHGWDDYWLVNHERASETLAAIEQALATC